MAHDYRYCIKGCDFGARGDCIFSSYQQCLASASGRDAWCAENPDFNAKAECLPTASANPEGGSDAHSGFGHFGNRNGFRR